MVIYEMGAGNGTLMVNIMEYLRQHAPHVYKQARYNIIEISQQLSERQEFNNISSLSEQVNKYQSKVSIINKSIFDWDTRIPDECFFIALEVVVCLFCTFLRCLL